MLYLMRAYPGADVKGIAVKVFGLIAGCLWCGIFQVEYGVQLVLLVFVLWIFGRGTPSPILRERPSLWCVRSAIPCSCLRPLASC